MNQMKRVPACENIKALVQPEQDYNKSGNRRRKRTYADESTRRICEAADKVYREKLAKQKSTTYKGGQ